MKPYYTIAGADKAHRHQVLLEDVADLMAQQPWSLDGLARRLHTTPGALDRALRRAGRVDTLTQLARNRPCPVGQWDHTVSR